MPLNTAALKSDLETLYASGKSGSGISDSQFADAMVSALSNFIQSGTVTVTGVQSGGSTATGTIS